MNRTQEINCMRHTNNTFTSHVDSRIFTGLEKSVSIVYMNSINSWKRCHVINELTATSDAAAETEFEKDDRYSSNSCKIVNTGKSSDKHDEVKMTGETIADILAEEGMIGDIEQSHMDSETNDSGRKKGWNNNVTYTCIKCLRLYGSMERRDAHYMKSEKEQADT